MALNLIYACADNGVIGRDNALPWHLPEDLAHFRQLTLGCPVLMGRKTWDSLPPKFRPLPGRLNLVLTRQADWLADGATRVATLEEALAHCPAGQDLWVIGGTSVISRRSAWGKAMAYTSAPPITHRSCPAGQCARASSSVATRVAPSASQSA